MSIRLAGDLRSGNVLMVENQPMQVVKAQYNKSGRNAAVVKIKMKHVLTGRISEVVHKADEKFEVVILDKKECTYSYSDGSFHVFVDTEYNQYEIPAESMEDQAKWLCSDMPDVVEVTFFEDRPISVEFPQTIVGEVEYTEPAMRGDTSGKVMKPATLKDSKYELQVSMFVQIGDKIEIDTATGEFKKRLGQ